MCTFAGSGPSLFPSSRPPPPPLPPFVSAYTLKKCTFPSPPPPQLLPLFVLTDLDISHMLRSGRHMLTTRRQPTDVPVLASVDIQRQTVFSHPASARPSSRRDASLAFNAHSCLQSWAGAVTFDLPHRLLSSARQASLH